MPENNDDRELLREFLVEAFENLERVERDMLRLEEHAEDASVLDSIFRGVHSVKGAAGFFGLGKLESVAHAGENLLNQLRDGRLQMSTQVGSVILSMTDALRSMLSELEKTGQEGEKDFSTLVQLLNGFSEKTTAATEPSTGSPTEQPLNTPQKPAHGGSELTDSTIRVQISLLDNLMDMVGELVLARNQIIQLADDQSHAPLVQSSQNLKLITTDLQEKIMKMRMQPISSVWNKFPRVVRDLALTCNKQISLEMEGKETELDKSIIEAIKDPLTHLLRNSVDHGIETPEKRQAAGKPPEGTIRLRAFHESGHVIIEIIDDGGGIDTNRIRAKALEKGLYTAEQLDGFSNREIVQLIFAPGFSTAEAVTNVSGRGVGMDVVKTNIEKIGGAIDIRSELGKGTTISIRIPLTLAIIPVLIVESGDNVFAISQNHLVELIRLRGEQIKTGIETIKDVAFHRRRGKLLPLIRLNQVISSQADPSGGFSSARNSEVINIVVLKSGSHRFGLIVDKVHDTQEIVVKPLGNQLREILVYAGATILGDGAIALVLDVNGIAHAANIAGTLEEDENLETRQGSGTAETKQQRRPYILIKTPDDGRAVIPLSLITRLEKFHRTNVETAGGIDVIQYRGGVLSLLFLRDLLPEYRTLSRNPTETSTELLHVLVYPSGEKVMGIVVDCILDIIDEHIPDLNPSGRKGVVGTFVTQDRITELLNLPELVAPVAEAL